MGWQFKWVSSHGSDFNDDFHVSFTEERCGNGKVNYNYRAAGVPERGDAGRQRVLQGRRPATIFHTYSAYARGLDILVGAYNLLDLVPKGRDEDKLPWSMAWVKHHDRYPAP